MERYTLFQNILSETIKNKLDIENRSDLTYTLNINISKLMDSMKEYQTPEEINREILIRINNIEKILNENNIGLISFFEDAKNNDILYKTEITPNDIDKLVNEINLCVSDKINKLCEFVEKNNGRFPSKLSNNKQEKQLANFRYNIQNIRENEITTILSKEQLQYLHDSTYDSLREIYKVILNRAIENNREMEYIDEDMKSKIIEFQQKKIELTIEEQIKLEQEYKDYIIIDSQFNEFIDYVLNNDGKLPIKSKEANEYEKQLANFRQSIQQINKTLSKEQLKYLHDSKYESLNKIYKVILNKAIENNIEIEYVDEEMKAKIIEFQQKKVGLTIEEQIKLEQEYKDYIIIDSQFNEFIDYVLNNDGKLPSKSSNNEQEKRLGGFRNGIQNFIINKKRFHIQLSKEQLQYLHDSTYDSLREIYKVILNRAIENNREIEYVDEKMKSKIIEFKQKKVGLTIRDQIKLEQDYKKYIIPDGQFNKFINFVLNNNGKLPNINSDNEQEKQLGSFRSSIQNIRTNKFKIQLSKEQLMYLHNSNYESLKGIYKVILNKAIENNIEIEYVDEEMKVKIIEFQQKKFELTIEEQIKLEQEYKDYIIIDSQFNEFIDYVLTNDGKLPSTNSKNDKAKKLENFRINIQNFKQKYNKFCTPLSKEQLEYLYNSEYQNLQELYNGIMNKAYSVNYKEYIDIDNEIRNNNRKGRAA